MLLGIFICTQYVIEENNTWKLYECLFVYTWYDFYIASKLGSLVGNVTFQ